jgi:UDP-glucose 4-epimerase
LSVLDGIKRNITGKVPQYENLDLHGKEKVQDFFKRHQDISEYIHFAASKAVGKC